jgi:hypothetical protein
MEIRRTVFILSIILPLCMISLANAGASFTVSPSVIDFGEVPVGCKSSRAATLFNTGTTDINPATVAGPAPFSGSAYSGAVPPGGSCPLTVVYYPNHPSPIGGDAGFVRFEDMDSGVVSDIQCSGSAVVGNADDYASIAVSPGKWDFGKVEVGEAQGRTFTVTNTGNVNTGIDTTLEGDKSCFITFNYCPDKLYPESACTVHVTFSPQYEGQETAVLEIDSSHVANQAVPLEGEGVAPGSGSSDGAGGSGGGGCFITAIFER